MTNFYPYQLRANTGGVIQQNEVKVFEIHAGVTSIKGLTFLEPSRSQMTILTGLGFLVCHA